VRRTLPERVTGEELGAGATSDGSRFLFLWGSNALGALQNNHVRDAPPRTKRYRHVAVKTPCTVPPQYACLGRACSRSSGSAQARG